LALIKRARGMVSFYGNIWVTQWIFSLRLVVTF
jgi:hypothetical protein